MTQYLLSIYQPDGATPDAGALEQIGDRLGELNDQLRDSGSWVFTGGLHAADTATVVTSDGMITDGPYAEAKEHIGGIYVINAPDLDAALYWGRRVAGATGLPIEVRPFQDRPPF